MSPGRCSIPVPPLDRRATGRPASRARTPAGTSRDWETPRETPRSEITVTREAAAARRSIASSSERISAIFRRPPNPSGPSVTSLTPPGSRDPWEIRASEDSTVRGGDLAVLAPSGGPGAGLRVAGRRWEDVLSEGFRLEAVPARRLLVQSLPVRPGVGEPDDRARASVRPPGRGRRTDQRERRLGVPGRSDGAHDRTGQRPPLSVPVSTRREP